MEALASRSLDTRYARGMEHLVTVIQELSMARDLETVQAIVRRAARALTGADGATFVLRDGDLCFYADEDAIEPLWKGKRFPMSACISGWAMLHRERAVIEDIYADPRIPHDAYRPTFVKSLAMVPIRTIAPVGAIGNYWAERHLADPTELRLLQALADSTSIAIENVNLYADLERRVQDRTAQLAVANRELETFSYSVSHDLRAPLRTIDGFAQALVEDCGEQLDQTGREHLGRIRGAAQRMGQLIDDLLRLARVTRAELRAEPVDVSALAREVGETLRVAHPDRAVELQVADGLRATGDPRLLRVIFENLLGNAWKFTARTAQARVEVGVAPDAAGGATEFFVRDNGAGFDQAYAPKLFAAFTRLHSDRDFPGTGVGLATVQRIVHRHGGRIRAEAAVGQGATFAFTLQAGAPAEPAPSR